MDAPKVDKHHGLDHGIDSTQFLGKSLDEPSEHVIRDVVATRNSVYSVLDEGAGCLFDDSAPSSRWCPVGDETERERERIRFRVRNVFGLNSPL